MPLNKLTLFREFGLGFGMALFLCMAPQSSPFWIGALFVGIFTLYETFPEWHWVPAWTAYKIVQQEEDVTQGVCRIGVQFLASILGGIIGFQLLDVPAAVVYPMFGIEDDWRTLVWVALVFGAWIGLTNHGNAKEDGTFRRNFGLTATFVSANYLLTAVGGGFILNTAVNFGRLLGAKIYMDGQDGAAEVKLDKLWLILVGPAVGVFCAWLALKIDSAFAEWAAPDVNNEETTAVYGSTGNDTVEAKTTEIALSPADDGDNQA